MSEDGNPVCTYSGANSCKEVRVCDYEYWIKWARLLSPMHSENAMKTSSSSTGLPLKSKSVKTWQTEVWRWSFLCNEKRFVDVSSPLPFPPQNGRGWGPYNATILWKMIGLKMGSSLPCCSNLWVLTGFIIFILKAWSFMGTKTNHFVTNQKASL